MKKYKMKKWIEILAVSAVSAVLFAGCSDESLEQELVYRTAGIESMEAGDYVSAVTAFENALQQHVGKIGQMEIDICYYKAASQYAAGDVEGALKSYQDLLSYDTEDGNAYYMKGCILLQQGETEQALSDFSNAVKYHENDYELYINIYENLAAYNLTEDGEAYLNKAFAIKGDEKEDLAWRGKIYTMLGEYENAAAELTSAIEKGSTAAKLYLAQVYDAQGDAENAEKYYREYVDAGEADAVALNALAEIEITKENYANALDYVNQGLAMEYVPNKKALLQNKLTACEYMGDFAAAWAVVQEYIVLYPDDMAAQREYIFLKNRQGVQEEPKVPEEPATEETIPEETEAATE